LDRTSRRWDSTNRHFRAASGIARIVVVVGLIAGTASAADSQVLYGGITGTVTDSSGATVPGASVTITHKATNFSRQAVTNETGIYSFTNVQAGAYDVKVSLSGFREFVETDVPVSVNQISRVDVRLDPGVLTETVMVQARSELLQTDKADVHTELRSTEITALPLNQFRNYQALINLVPGATPGVFQNAETDTPARSLSTNVNGQNRNNNGTRTDGATNLNVWLPHHNVYVSPAETIDSVNISTDNFDAEQGMAGGAAVTVITKSGTNVFKGSAFEFFNSEKLNATPYFFGSGPKPGKLPITRNIYGGTIGGPIRRNRLFFFGSFEGYRQDLRHNNFFNVPNAALRAGDFSDARNTNGTLQTIYDPLTGNPDGSGRTPFPGNVIPANRLNPIALKLLAVLPAAELRRHRCRKPAGLVASDARSVSAHHCRQLPAERAVQLLLDARARYPAQRLADQRDVCRLFRHAVQRDGQRRDREHAGQHADGGPRRNAEKARPGRLVGHLLRHQRVGAAAGRSVREHGPQSVPWAGRGESRYVTVPFIPTGW
jgi:Carboxypeptidase regulatory-like domain